MVQAVTPTQRSLPYVERRPPSTTMRWLIAGMLAVPVIIMWQDLQRGEPVTASLWYSLGVIPLIIGVLLWIGYGPLGTEGRHLRVDERGLRMGKRHLPAERIGRVRILEEDAAAAASARGRADGLKIPHGHSSFAAVAGDGRAVLVEERPGRGWLLSTRDADRLAAALEASRDGT
jgi:hypothetical protein